MPKTKQRRPASKAAAAAPEPTICEKADLLFRSAAECCRQHRRYARRHSLSDRASGEFRAHNASKLASLGVEYELEASSLLALQHAVEAYRKLRPEADWNTTAPRG